MNSQSAATGENKPAASESGNGNAITQDDAIRARSAAREQNGGKATSPERDAMYDDLEDVGESGAQGDLPDPAGQNPIVGNR